MQEIADQVWDEAIAGHLAAGSTGEALNNAGAAASPAAIADAVWDELIVGHNVEDSFGNVINDLTEEPLGLYRSGQGARIGTPTVEHQARDEKADQRRDERVEVAEPEIQALLAPRGLPREVLEEPG